MDLTQDESGRNCPYRGLEPFDERDAAFFFGRERETRLITASLFASPLTLLYGASGVGKSSVLRAGVLPRLRSRADLLPVVFPTLVDASGTGGSALRGWQSDPVGGVKEAVAVALYQSAGDDYALRARYQHAVLSEEMAPLRAFLAACHEVSGRRLMIILDQFEEYSLYHPEDDDFGRQFPQAIVAGDLAVSFLVSLREDSLARLDRFKGRIPTLWNSYRRVDHLDHKAAEDAVRLPLREYNRQRPNSPPITVQDALVDVVLSEVQTESVQFEETGAGTVTSTAQGGPEGRIETPYLQLVMTRLWERELAENSTELRLATLQSEGGSAEIVRTHLDRVMEQFSVAERDIAARVFHRLVTPSGAKIAFSVRDLAEYEAIEPELLAPILKGLEEGSRRILRRVASRADVEDEPRYEIFHDRLGKAILSWRARRQKDQERERRQREEAEQKRAAEAGQASFRKHVHNVMEELGPELQGAWLRMMVFLVTTDGRRLAQTATNLAELSHQDRDLTAAVLERMLRHRVLRAAYHSTPSPDQFYEVVDDTMASVLLEWHAQFVLRQARGASPAPVPAAATEASPAPEFPYKLVRELLQRGGVIPFLGAGASMSARPPMPVPMWDADQPFLPSARELKEKLARACDFPPSELEHSDIAEVASFLVQRLGRTALDAMLQEMLGRPEFQPSTTHRLLAEIAQSSPLLILTTNYDTLMEQALDQVQAPYETWTPSPRDANDFAALERYVKRLSETASSHLGVYDPGRDRTVVFRLNGPTKEKGYVVTEEDQIDWIVRLSSALPPALLKELQRLPLLSLGHSARDWSQRALLRALHEKRRSQMRSWAVSLNPAPLSVMTWQRYGVEVHNLDLNEWAARVRSA